MALDYLVNPKLYINIVFIVRTDLAWDYPGV